MSVFNTFRSLDDLYLQASLGKVKEVYSFHKQGLSPDVGKLEGFVNIWDGMASTAVSLLPDKIPEIQFSDYGVADITQLSSSNNIDTVQIIVAGLDINGDRSFETITLTGQTPAILDTPLWRVFNIKVGGYVDPIGNIYCTTSGATLLGGIPQVSSEVRAIIISDNNTSKMNTITVPKGHRGIIAQGWSEIAKEQITEVVGHFKSRQYGGVWIHGDDFALTTSGTSRNVRDYRIPITFEEMTDINYDVQAFTNNTGIAGGLHVIMMKIEEEEI